TSWWINGVIQESGIFKNDQKNGVFTGFHENGRKAYEARFENGLRVSLETWSVTGEPITREAPQVFETPVVIPKE
ncbi:MAG: hypothetical protein VX969_00260, partial [Verrucomicrobiota bacterium]|nr:hypothetical protein [Verrucomicrobiota bacterium]